MMCDLRGGCGVVLILCRLLLPSHRESRIDEPFLRTGSNSNFVSQV